MKESKKTKGSKSKKASKVEKSVAVSVDNEGIETPEEVVAEEMEVTTNINDVEVGEDTEVIKTEEEAQNETEIEQEEVIEESSKKKEKSSKKQKETKTKDKAEKKPNKKNESKKSNNDDNKDSKDKPRVKSEEYFIKVQYPNKADFPNGTHITITAPDKKNFKESKEYYHKAKEEFKYEAAEVSFIGVGREKEQYILHSKRFKNTDTKESIKANLQQIVSLKNEILDQLNDLQVEIMDLKVQKEHIEDEIRNADYSNIKQSKLPTNDFIRLKYILTRIEESKEMMNSMRAVLDCTTLFADLEAALEKLN